MNRPTQILLACFTLTLTAAPVCAQNSATPATAPATANAPTTATARPPGVVLDELYPGQDIAAKLNEAKAAPARASHPGTATLVVRRRKEAPAALTGKASGNVTTATEPRTVKPAAIVSATTGSAHPRRLARFPQPAPAIPPDDQTTSATSRKTDEGETVETLNINESGDGAATGARGANGAHTDLDRALASPAPVATPETAEPDAGASDGATPDSTQDKPAPNKAKGAETAPAVDLTALLASSPAPADAAKTAGADNPASPTAQKARVAARPASGKFATAAARPANATVATTGARIRAQAPASTLAVHTIKAIQPDVSTTGSTPTAAGLAPANAGAAMGGVCVNSASIYDLQQKLKIDARRARLIVEFRNLYGRFKGPDDLGQVSGITDDMIRRWEQKDILIFD